MPPSAPPVEALKTGRMTEEAFSWRNFEATIQNKDKDNVLNPKFWRLNLHRLRRGDRINWRTDDLVSFGTVVVIGVDLNSGNAELRSLWSHDVAPQTLIETERATFSAKDFGVFDGWGVVRDDGQVIEKNLPSFDEAMRKIKSEHLRNHEVQNTLARRLA